MEEVVWELEEGGGGRERGRERGKERGSVLPIKSMMNCFPWSVVEYSSGEGKRKRWEGEEINVFWSQVNLILLNWIE